MCVLPFPLIFCAFVILNSNYFCCIQIILSQSRCSLEPKKTPDPLALLTLAMIAFLLIMFTPGIMSVFYLILIPASFSDIHPCYNKMMQD